MATATAGVVIINGLAPGGLGRSRHEGPPAKTARSRPQDSDRRLPCGGVGDTYPHAFAAVSPRGTRQAQGPLGQMRARKAISAGQSVRNPGSQASPETRPIGGGPGSNENPRWSGHPAAPGPRPSPPAVLARPRPSIAHGKQSTSAPPSAPGAGGFWPQVPSVV